MQYCTPYCVYQVHFNSRSAPAETGSEASVVFCCFVVFYYYFFPNLSISLPKAKVSLWPK